jgi:Rps23 Pro-64 3,4-dihydroxylase Tpa1-like proline 4-hydroxylase
MIPYININFFETLVHFTYQKGAYMDQEEKFINHLLSRLHASAVDIKHQWNNPFETKTRHFYIDNLMDDDVCEAIYGAFPRNGSGFFSRETFREKKRTSANLSDYDPILADIIYAFQDKRVVDLIADLVEFNQIEPDPKLYAGGLSMMFPGDFLNPHIDNSHDGERSRFRRLNLLYYVSPLWKLDFGGNFELWNEKITIPKTVIAATNRLVVMETNKTSWHSVSPVKVDRPRCCVSNYYFSQVSPDGSDYFHVTSFTGRPEEKLKRTIGSIDNALRNFVSKTFKLGRGKDLVNKDKL